MSFLEPPKNKSAVRKAGKAIARQMQTDEDIELVDQWRSAHGCVLNNFNGWLRVKLKKQKIDAVITQRLKRRKTVIDKLRRKKLSGEYLIQDVTTMHDFAGCRLIFNSIDELYDFREELHSKKSMESVMHKLKHTDKNKYNYIENPKNTGYRGIHDVFKHYPGARRRKKKLFPSLPWDGLLIEIQYRTRSQHAWATAVEISDIIDGSRTKFGSGGNTRETFFAIASEIISRKAETPNRRPLFNAYQGKTIDDLYANLDNLERNLNILKRFQALRKLGGADKLRKHTVLDLVKVSDTEYNLNVHIFRTARKAIAKANELETNKASANVVYVSASDPAQLRSAYKNYFNDPVDFMEILRQCPA